MPAPFSFDFAVIRVVPRVDREEFINAGVIVFCLEVKFLRGMVHLNEGKLLRLDPDTDITAVRTHLEAILRICEGSREGGPIGALTVRERFHWLVAPRSTVIQISPVHSGLSSNPHETLEHLLQRLVL